MTKRISYVFVVIVFIITTACTQVSKSPEVAATAIPVCGTVQFSDGCNDEVDAQISYGIALVHHMTYEEAERVFDGVVSKTPECFWGHWGKAMTYIHPLWNDPPNEERLKTGWALSQQALKVAKNEKETRYGNAIAAYYENGSQKSDKERLKAFNESWRAAHQANPKDIEVKAFYALTLIAVADPADQTFTNQLRAGAIAEEIMTEIADHPAAYHYRIHAYDYPGLSDKALEVAKTYGTIAPQIPHALHMPSHIFTRLGMWQESIEWNTKSAARALEMKIGNAVSGQYFHALDYMIYAYLQQGQDEKAKSLIAEMRHIQGAVQSHGTTAYSLASSESRYFLERKRWDEAANMTIQTSNFNWTNFPEYEVQHHFAKGMGAARNGKPDVAEAELTRIADLQQQIKNPYWGNQAEIQKNIIRSWIAFAKGDKKQAIELMKTASEMEWSTQKAPITPGELLPAREMFGDMLMQMSKPKEALEQYELSLQRSPRRLNSLFGAATAAEKTGDDAKAKTYYEQLLEVAPKADANLEIAQKAKSYLKIS
jgi:tetratricopeptide (TPR) repeat protein